MSELTTLTLGSNKTVSGFSQTQQYILFYFLVNWLPSGHLYKTYSKVQAVQVILNFVKMA